MVKLRSLLEQFKWVVTTAGLILIILLGVLDYVTGPQFSFSIFYLLPISFVTWLADWLSGIIVALFSAITWLIADLTTQTAYSHPLIPYWNAMVRLLVFLAIVFLESSLKNLNQGLEDRVKLRTALLEAEINERKKVEQRLNQYAERLVILHKIDQVILAAQSLEIVARTTMQYVRNLLSCDRVSFMLFDFETKQVILFDTADDDQEAEISESHINIDSLADFDKILELLQQGDIQLHNDLLSSPLATPIVWITQIQDYRSLMLVPIIVQGEPIGSIILMAVYPNAFLPDHQEIGREVANQLGIAIKQATLIDQLRVDQENLQALSQQLLEIQETERRSIARELHDEVGQALTGIALILEMTVPLQDDTIRKGLNQAHALVVELMERVSQLSLDLRPALLDDLGLLPTLLWFLDRYSVQTNIKITLKHTGLEGQRFNPEVETAAYRIVQEALTNVARYARVGEARLSVWYDQGILGIRVEDEGNGFNPDMVLLTGNAGGLLGMRERVSLLNGKLTIESAQGNGTRLLAEIPVNGQTFNERDQP
jgi:signal transduction histidine kinase